MRAGDHLKTAPEPGGRSSPKSGKRPDLSRRTAPLVTPHPADRPPAIADQILSKEFAKIFEDF